MAPNAFDRGVRNVIWTPRLTFGHFRQWSHAPAITEYSPQAQIKGTTRTPVTLTADTTQDLDAKCTAWEKEIERLEAECGSEPLTLKDILASMMFTVDVPNIVKHQEKMWDPKGDGTITRGEFRMHIRGLGIRSNLITNADCDELFTSWDIDSSGTIDMYELVTALNALHAEWSEQQGKEGLARLRKQEKVEGIRKRVKAARDASA